MFFFVFFKNRATYNGGLSKHYL